MEARKRDSMFRAILLLLHYDLRFLAAQHHHVAGFGELLVNRSASQS